jgi:hypothetical protein
MTNRDLQSLIGNDIGDYADLIVRKASKQPTKEHRYVPVGENNREAGSANNAPASNHGR